MSDPRLDAASLDGTLALERDGFLRELLGHLAATLQEVVGPEEAEGYITLVGQRVGEALDRRYRAALGVERLERPELPVVLVDLKRRIRGEFRVEADDGEHLLLHNDACPFGEDVHDRPALCMMTSNVFGTIAAENFGHARVVLHETIARGDGRCRVAVHLGAAARDATLGGREYYRVEP